MRQTRRERTGPWRVGGMIATALLGTASLAQAQPPPRNLPGSVQLPAGRNATLPPPALPTLLPPDAEPDTYEETRSIRGQTCAVRVHHADPEVARKAVLEAHREIARVLAKLDPQSRTSEVYSLNADAATDEVFVSDETLDLLQRSLDLCRRTAGAFDPTVASFDYLWNFAARPFVRPLPDEVAARRTLTGCRQIAIKPSRAVRILQPGVRLTLAGIAPGHALERASAVLRQAGVESFRVALGRDVYVQGRIGTRHWHAAVPHPRRPEESVALLYLGSHCAATRSDSDRFVVKNGKRYHDVLDPRTGQPAEGVVQATVIATDPALADALSHAVFVLGPRAGLALLEKEKNVEGFLIDAAGKVHATSGMGDLARLPAKVTL